MIKKGKKLRMMLLMALTLAAGSVGAVTGTGAKQVQAADYYSVSIQNFQQTDWGKTTATVSWDLQESSYSTEKTAGYNIWLGTSSRFSEMKMVGTTTEKSYTLRNLQDGKYYYLQVGKHIPICHRKGSRQSRQLSIISDRSVGGTLSRSWR